LCFVFFFLKKIYLTLAWRGEREMPEQKKVGSATGAAVLILFEGGGSAGSVLIFLYFFIFFLIEIT